MRIADASAVVIPAWLEPGQDAQQRDPVRATRTHGGWRLDGRKAVVVAAPWATHFIVSAQVDGMTGTSLFVLPCETPGLALLTYPTVDDRRAADLKFAGAIGRAHVCTPGTNAHLVCRLL